MNFNGYFSLIKSHKKPDWFFKNSLNTFTVKKSSLIYKHKVSPSIKMWRNHCLKLNRRKKTRDDLYDCHGWNKHSDWMFSCYYSHDILSLCTSHLSTVSERGSHQMAIREGERDCLFKRWWNQDAVFLVLSMYRGFFFQW